MKSIHFCTPEKLLQIKKCNYFDSIRTGWIPQLFTNDIVRINERENKKDVFLFLCKILSVRPIQYKDMNLIRHKEELDRYNKKFHPEQYFFLIRFEKCEKNA